MQNIATATATLSALENANTTIMVETATTPKMNKRNNPLFGRVCKHTAYIGVNFGNYAEEVNARRAEEGKATDFVAQASVYTTINKYFVSKGGQVYLRMLMDKDCRTQSIWMVDNRPATTEEIETIKAFLPARRPNATQGLTAEVQVRNIKVENVVAIGTDAQTIAW